MTLKLAALLAEKHQLALPAKVSAALPAAQATLEKSSLPSAQALLLMSSKAADRTQAAERILDSVRAEMPTFDRALTLIWLNKVMAGKVIETGDLSLDASWIKATSVTGSAVWRPKGSNVPATITLANAPTKALSAYVQYESATQETAQLAVKVERQLYRLDATSAAPAAPSSESSEVPEKRLQFNLAPISDSDTVQTNDLYLEEIKLTPENNVRVKYGIVEVPLPPGAEVESSTWGISVSEGVPLERATSQPSRGGYAIPVERVDQPVVLRHLLRFSQKGKYKLPPARFYSMYAPQKKAFENVSTARVLTVK
jgi:hypothetical protein